MTGIAPGAYVRVTRGMYAGTTGRVVNLHAMESAAPYATVDVGDVCVGVSVSALELVGATSTTEQERDAAIAERDRLRAEVDVLRGVGCCEDRGPHEPTSGPCGVCIKCARAERDRLRAEVTDLLPEADAKTHFATRALRAEERLERLRAEVQKLRDRVRRFDPGAFVLASDVAEALGDMLEEP